MTPGDTLVVLDMGNQRLQRFASDGTALESPHFSAADGVPLRVRGNSNGVMAVQLRRWALAGQDPAEDQEDVIVVPGRDGRTRDTLLAFPPGRGDRYTAGGPPEYTIKAPEPSWDLTAPTRWSSATAPSTGSRSALSTACCRGWWRSAIRPDA